MSLFTHDALRCRPDACWPTRSPSSWAPRPVPCCSPRCGPRERRRWRLPIGPAASVSMWGGPRWLTARLAGIGPIERIEGSPSRRRSSTRPAERTRRAEPTRAAAYHLLRAVEEGAYANLELPKVLRRSHLAGRDAAFTTELAFGTLRHRAFYDAVIAVAADRPITAIDGRVPMSCGSERTNCWQMCPITPPSTRRWAWLGRGPWPRPAVSSTRSCGGSAKATGSWLVRVRPPGGAAALALEYSAPRVGRHRAWGRPGRPGPRPPRRSTINFRSAPAR